MYEVSLISKNRFFRFNLILAQLERDNDCLFHLVSSLYQYLALFTSLMQCLCSSYSTGIFSK